MTLPISGIYSLPISNINQQPGVLKMNNLAIVDNTHQRIQSRKDELRTRLAEIRTTWISLRDEENDIYHSIENELLTPEIASIGDTVTVNGGSHNGKKMEIGYIHFSHFNSENEVVFKATGKVFKNDGTLGVMNGAWFSDGKAHY